MGLGLIITLSVIGAVVLLFLIFLAAGYTKAPTDTALIITGPHKQRVLVGKAGFRIPFFERVDRLSLSLMSIDIKTRNSVPTKEFINVNVDAVANIKIGSTPEMLQKAAEALLNKSQKDIENQVIQVLEGNIREIVGASQIRDMVQDRKGIADKVRENVAPDMAAIGIEVVNFNIQNFTDDNNVIENLGIDNIAQISKDAAIARANADRDVSVAQAQAKKDANEAKVKSDTTIIQQNTEYELKAAELKQKSDTAKADADAAYKIRQQEKQELINTATINAQIAQREREVELGNKEVELTQKRLEAEINKKADADKYAAQQRAEAAAYTRIKEAEAELAEAQRQAEMAKVKAEAQKVARQQAAEAEALEAEAQKRARAEAAAAAIIEADAKKKALVAEAEAKKQAALAEAEGIEAKGKAEAEAILKKADAMKQYGEAATLKMILESDVLPKVVEAYSKPMAEAMSHIGNITMYGEGNTAKLNEEITKNGTQIFAGLEQATGLDIKSLLVGTLGGKLISNSVKGEAFEVKEVPNTPTPKKTTSKKSE